ncbi:MAG: LCP family protein [Clostridiales bacterium]|nr:LCP family protein [Clostridiales bacterium]
MNRTSIHNLHSIRGLIKLIAIALVLCFLPSFAVAEESAVSDSWVDFLLICNEGMNNDKGNAGNTLMVVSMNPESGKIRLLMFTWDTFIDYEGYDVPQMLDMPYRNNGPEEAMKVFNYNFGTNIKYFLSLNYLNLAEMIDDYGGIDVDVSRAERNALNGMVGSKKNQLIANVGSGLLAQAVIDMLAEEYYLTEFGPDTHLNGLQAVGFGWLQYDSVYNCCEREVEVIAGLFKSCGATISKKIAFYTNETGVPEGDLNGQRLINLDDVTEEDYAFIREQIDPIFRKSYNNLPEEDIRSISLALARVAYEASKQGVNIFDSQSLDYMVLPLEATQEYDIIAGAKGHIVDKEANSAAIAEFLFKEDN